MGLGDFLLKHLIVKILLPFAVAILLELLPPFLVGDLFVVVALDLLESFAVLIRLSCKVVLPSFQSVLHADGEVALVLDS
jgi:hypothetical protein